MANSRSISTDLWGEARGRLVFYFSRHHGFENAEDLAHTTLMTIWIREDYVFEKEEDFLRVCLGFARNVAKEATRGQSKYIKLEPDDENMPLFHKKVNSLEKTEASVFLDELVRISKAKLNAQEWAIIQATINRDGDDQPVKNGIRVRVHRARKKLAKLTGWE